jgi:hypothetical protein
MNPTATAQPARPRTLADVTRPASHPAPAAAHAPAAPASDAAFATNIVDNIPMHTPAPAAAPVLTEDDELDTIMKDVGHQLKQADRKTTKKHSLFGRRRQAPAPKPVPMPKAAAAAPAAPQPTVPVRAVTVDSTVKAAPKPVKTSSAPLGAIFMTILVTGALIAAAIYSYK